MNEVPLDILQRIEKLTERQLHALYHVVVERLKLFEKTKALYEMQQFHIHDRVSFTYNGQYKNGIVLRLNQKTVTVLVDDGIEWKVSPHLLKKVLQTVKN